MAWAHPHAARPAAGARRRRYALERVASVLAHRGLQAARCSRFDPRPGHRSKPAVGFAGAALPWVRSLALVKPFALVRSCRADQPRQDLRWLHSEHLVGFVVRVVTVSAPALPRVVAHPFQLARRRVLAGEEPRLVGLGAALWAGRGAQPVGKARALRQSGCCSPHRPQKAAQRGWAVARADPPVKAWARQAMPRPVPAMSQAHPARATALQRLRAKGSPGFRE